MHLCFLGFGKVDIQTHGALLRDKTHDFLNRKEQKAVTIRLRLT
jgi:hypothetical protein